MLTFFFSPRYQQSVTKYIFNSAGFLSYCLCVIIFCVVMIYKVAPKYGRRNPLVYISICSTIGSVSVMSVKAFGIALKLTLEGNNQFTRPSTYIFALVVGGCVLTQMNYFNKALSMFSTSMWVFVISNNLELCISTRLSTNHFYLTASTQCIMWHSRQPLSAPRSFSSTGLIPLIASTLCLYCAAFSSSSAASISSTCHAMTRMARA